MYECTLRQEEAYNRRTGILRVPPAPPGGVARPAHRPGTPAAGRAAVESYGSGGGVHAGEARGTVGRGTWGVGRGGSDPRPTSHTLRPPVEPSTREPRP